MIRFFLFFCSPFFLVICDENKDLNKDYDVSKAVEEIISGARKNQEISNDLKIVSQFYENPKPELFSKQEISLTCLGKKKNFTWNKIRFKLYCSYSLFNRYLSYFPFHSYTVPESHTTHMKYLDMHRVNLENS